MCFNCNNAPLNSGCCQNNQSWFGSGYYIQNGWGNQYNSNLNQGNCGCLKPQCPCKNASKNCFRVRFDGIIKFG